MNSEYISKDLLMDEIYDIREREESKTAKLFM